MSTGIVFDVQRFAEGNGPGIRTVVYFKGCPLHCPWCPNPEARRSERELAYLANRCISCGVCSRVCPNHAVKFEEGQQHIILRDRCVVCGDCVEACVSRALALTGREMTVSDVMEEVRKDQPYYEKSGGGITITGGEPTQQMGFLVDLLQAARAEGIHTCLETAGCASQADFRRLLPLVDLFLFDYKATGAEYQNTIGVDEELILANLAFLNRSGARVTLRCPLVPGVNDTPLYLEAIARLERTYPGMQDIELLPYQTAYTSKFERYGYTNPLPNLPAAVDADRERWMEALKKAGSQKAHFAG